MAENGRKSTEIYRLPPVVRVFTQPGSKPAGRQPLNRWPLSAHLSRSRIFQRRSPHGTQNGRSALAARTGLHAPQLPFAFDREARLPCLPVTGEAPGRQSEFFTV